MERIALVLVALLLVGTGHAAAGDKPAPAAAAAGDDLYCPTDPPTPPYLAQFAPDAQQGCVTLHRDEKMRARVFTDPAIFANACPIIVEDFIPDGNCLNHMNLPPIQRGDRIHLDNFAGSYQLTIVSSKGALVSSVPLTPREITLGTAAEQVKGYAWLQGSDGGLVYYVYMNDERKKADQPDTNRHYFVEVFVASDHNCADDAPDVSAKARRDCAPTTSTGPAALGQGGTGPGGEPPPTQRP